MAIDAPKNFNLRIAISGLFLIASFVLVTLALIFNKKVEVEEFKVNYDALSLVDIPVKGTDVLFVKSSRRYYTPAAFEFVFVPAITKSISNVKPESLTTIVEHDKKLEPFGLVNPGFYCFFNSLLQCFAAIHPYMLPYELKSTQPNYELAKNFVSFIKHLRNGKPGEAIQSDPLFQQFRAAEPPFSKENLFDCNQQHDSEELLTLILGWVMKMSESDFFIRSDPIDFTYSFNISFLFHASCDANSDHSWFKLQPETENHWVLQLFGSERVKLETLFEKYSKPDILDDLNCEKCGKKGTGKRISMLGTPPPHIMIISLSRFKYDWNTKATSKNNLPVIVPEFIEPEFKNEQGETTKKRYKLAAINLQTGSLRMGHYTALVRYPCGKKDKDTWFYCNDEEVTESSLDIIANGNYEAFTPYILFYVSC